MIDDRELLERAMRRFEPDPGLTERVMRRRDRKRRNQRIGAGVVGGLIALVLVSVAVRSTFTDPAPADEPSPAPSPIVGFIGLPPEGAEPSTPIEGELVLSLDSTVSSGDPYKTTLYVYADGRMIWERHAAPTGVPEGARPRNTGYLEQVLTAEGVEALRSEAIASGLFEADLHLKGGWAHNEDIYGTRISVLGDDGETVSLEWAAGYPDDRRPTPAEFDAIRPLVQRLGDPGVWLPETAWEDRQIRAFVAAEYWVNFSLVAKPDGNCCLHPDPAILPPPADELLDRRFNQCLSTDEARMLAEGFEGAGIAAEEGFGFGSGLEYVIETPPGVMERQYMSLYPSLPHWGRCR